MEPLVETPALKGFADAFGEDTDEVEDQRLLLARRVEWGGGSHGGAFPMGEEREATLTTFHSQDPCNQSITPWCV